MTQVIVKVVVNEVVKYLKESKGNYSLVTSKRSATICKSKTRIGATSEAFDLAIEANKDLNFNGGVSYEVL